MTWGLLLACRVCFLKSVCRGKCQVLVLSSAASSGSKMPLKTKKNKNKNGCLQLGPAQHLSAGHKLRQSGLCKNGSQSALNCRFVHVPCVNSVCIQSHHGERERVCPFSVSWAVSLRSFTSCFWLWPGVKKPDIHAASKGQHHLLVSHLLGMGT